MTEVSVLLKRLQQGDSVAADELAPLVYSELHRVAAAKMALERGGHTLQATALVHEAWLRPGDGVFANRAHSFGAAAPAMRQILVDRARRMSATSTKREWEYARSWLHRKITAGS